jgi:dolichyl-phosphooligosaccharide-protein glycotransferase
MIPCGRVRPLSGRVLAFALAAVFAGALWIRVEPPHPVVFRDGGVVLLSNDPWIYGRQVDEILRDFPRPKPFDRLRLHPGGQANEAPLFPLALASAAWALGGGSPSPALVDRVLAWAPAILGALVPLPVFALGRRLFGAAAGVLAAAIVALLPGQLLQRSLLGYTDHHVAESLLSLLVLASLAAGLDTSGRARTRWSVVAGIWLAAYLLSWARGVLLPLVLVLWAAIQTVRDHTRETELPAPWATLGPAFGVALLLVLPLVGWPALVLAPPVLALGAAAVYGMAAASRALEARGKGRLVLLFVGAGAAVALAVLLRLFAPFWVGELLALVQRFGTTTAAATIGETRPLLFLSGRFSLAPVWNELRTSALLGVAGLVLLVMKAARERRSSQTLLLVWSLVALGLTIGQVRFGYYLAPAVALLAALAVSRLVRGLHPAFAVVAAVCLAVYPALPPALTAARSPMPGPSKDWLETLDWLRRETPDPSASPYGVLAWCDYGYWITRIAGRAPSSNPTQHGATEVAAFLLETDEEEGRRKLEALDARYLVLDSDLLPGPLQATGPVWIGQLDTLVRWAGRPASDYYQVLFEKDSTGQLRATVAYTPAYYQSMLFRLAVLAGEAAEPRDGAWVIDVEKAERQGRSVEAVKEARRFTTEADARDSLASGDNHRLLGRDPFHTCVRLPSLKGYSLRHASRGSLALADGRTLPAVAVFEVQTPVPR